MVLIPWIRQKSETFGPQWMIKLLDHLHGEQMGSAGVTYHEAQGDTYREVVL